ncbi:MAG TPA: DUF5615 family PIN-like protein, partial [Opitutales bacterium]|nr:DUF5615 family PIN-like protein [Opitutales bacterium]
ASDTLLWEVAREKSWIIVTRDTDFFNRMVLSGPPPKVIWIRLGNLRKSDLEQISIKWDLTAELIATNDLIQVYRDSFECMKFEH